MHDLPTRLPDATTSRTPTGVPAAAPLQIVVSHEGRKCVVRLGGELDVATAGRLRGALQLVCTGEHDLVVIDLDELRFLSLAGLHVLADAQRTLQAAGRQLVLRNPNALTRRVLAITGLDQVLHLTSATEHGTSAKAPDAPQR